MPTPPAADDKPIPGERGWTQRIKDENGNPSTTIIFYKLVDQPIDLEKLENERAEAENSESKKLLEKWKEARTNQLKCELGETGTLEDKKYRNFVKPRMERAQKEFIQRKLSIAQLDQRIKEILVEAEPLQSETLRAYKKQASEYEAAYDAHREKISNDYQDYKTFIEAEYTKGRTIVSFSSEFATQTHRAIKEIEGIADIRYFDLAHLTEQDRAYLAAHKISIPKQENLTLGYMEGPFNIAFGKKEPSAIACASWPVDNRAAIIMSGNADNVFPDVIRHELMHTLNFEHINEAAIFPEHREGAAKYTVMTTYENMTNNRFQEWDVERLQQVYGVSKNPSDFSDQLAQEERNNFRVEWSPFIEERMMALREQLAWKQVEEKLIPALTEELDSLTRDKIFDDADLQTLREKAKAWKETLPDHHLLPDDLDLTLSSEQKKGECGLMISGSPYYVGVKKFQVSPAESSDHIPLFPAPPKVPGDLPPR